MSSVRYFHGGVPGLEVGDFLLPGFGASQRPYVCITTDFQAARTFAMWFYRRGLYGNRGDERGGDLYEVEPENVESGIPDCDARHRFRCSRARIVRVLARGVTDGSLRGVGA